MFSFNRYLTRLVVFTIGVSSLPIIVLGIIFYVKSSGTIQSKVNEGNVHIMEQTRLRVEQVLFSVDRQIERLAESNLVLEALNRDITPTHFQLVQDLLNSMSRVQTFDVGVQDIHLVNLNKGWMLDNNGFIRLADTDTSRIDRYAAMERTKFWISEPAGLSRFQRSGGAPVVSLVRKIPAFSENPLGLFIVEIPSRQLRNFLTKGNTLGEVLILDESYQMLATLNKSLELDPGKLERMAGPLLGFEDVSGLYESSAGDARVGVAYQRSPYNNWVYVSVIPIDLIRLESRQTGWIILVSCILLLLAAVLISLKGSQRMYAPVRKLYHSLFAGPDKEPGRIDEFHMINEGFLQMRRTQVQMADQIKLHKRQLEEFYVLKLVQGDMKPAEAEEKLTVLGHDRSRWKRMAALTIQIDTLEGTRYNAQDGELLLFAIGNIVGDLIPREHRLLPIIVRSSLVAIVFDDPKTTEEFRAFAYSTAKTVQEQVGNYLSLRISIGISRPHDGLQETRQAYREASEALKYRMLFGQRTILRIDDVQPHSTAAVLYPKEAERRLLDAVTMADRDEIPLLLEQLFEEISAQSRSYGDYQIAVTRFFVNLIRLLQESGIPYQKAGEDPPLLEQLHALATADQVREWFSATIIGPAVAAYEEQRRSKYRNISQEVLKLIHERYDTDLSLEACSNLLNYHPSYISKVLRQELGISFSDYLMQYRLNKAKELLQNTEMKVAEIAETLRYNNSQNFIRSFRKVVGMTPGAYRERALGSPPRTGLVRLPKGSGQ